MLRKIKKARKDLLQLRQVLANINRKYTINGNIEAIDNIIDLNRHLNLIESILNRELKKGVKK